MKELSGRKIDLDEVTDQSLQLEETLRKLFWNHLPQWELKRMARTTFITIMTYTMIMMRMKRIHCNSP